MCGFDYDALTVDDNKVNAFLIVICQYLTTLHFKHMSQCHIVPYFIWPNYLKFED